MTRFKIEQFSEGSIIARRNVMVGTWAGMRLGYRGDRLSRYVRDIIDADYEIPGPEDVIKKIAGDFANNGVDFPPDLIALELERIERSLRTELLATDEPSAPQHHQ